MSAGNLPCSIRTRRPPQASPRFEGPASVRAPSDLTFVDDRGPGIRRRRAGKSFAYYDLQNRVIRSKDVLARIRALAIPPAYTDVWICPSANGHIQATGRDSRGRKQYRYHARWREFADATKFEHTLAFAEALPQLRARVATDMALSGLPRQKVLATIVSLLEATLIRIGNAEYARQNASYGLTTLRNRHVRICGTELRFGFKGKSGKTWRLSLRDRRVASVVRSCQELPGQHLFQYVDEEGRPLAVTSADVNDYLREITGREITAKDFRTWADTVLAAASLAQVEPFESAADATRNLRKVVLQVAARLGNTASVCRKSYIHPEIAVAYLAGELVLRDAAGDEKRQAVEWRSYENGVVHFLRGRSSR